MVAIDSARSLSPYRADMPMQPRPSAETAGPVAPRGRAGTEVFDVVVMEQP